MKNSSIVIGCRQFKNYCLKGWLLDHIKNIICTLIHKKLSIHKKYINKVCLKLNGALDGINIILKYPKPPFGVATIVLCLNFVSGV
jgi:hypothetical protein